MIVPTDADPLSAENWVVIVYYDESGHVSDEEAAEIDYDELLAERQEEVAEESRQRVAQGYQGVELLGWARQPFYDAEEKKLHWAEHLRFGGSEENLNYDIRV